MARNTTGPDRLLDRTALLNAIHLVFANEYAGCADEAGGRLPTRYEGSLEAWAPRLADEAMNSQTFLWLLREATADPAERISRDLIADREQRWSQYVHRNLIPHLKLKAD